METISTSATSAAANRINIISDEIVHPPLVTSQSILRAFIEKGVKQNPSRNIRTSSKDYGHEGLSKDKLNLLDGLGEDFLDVDATENAVAEFYMADLADAFFAADPSDTKVKEKDMPQIVECINQIPAVDEDELESAIRDLEHANDPSGTTTTTTAQAKESAGAPYLKHSSPLPNAKLGQAPSILPAIGSLSRMDNAPLKEKSSLSSIIGGSKRKNQRGGKDLKKIRKHSNKEKTPLASSSCQLSDFSQSEDKSVITKFVKMFSLVAEKKKFYERQLEESTQKRKSLVHRKEEAEAQQKINDDRMRQILEEINQLKKDMADKKNIARENSKLIASLRTEEKQIVTTDQYNQEQLDKYSRKLAILRQLTDDTV